MPGSLVFGAATSDRVSYGSPVALDDLDPFTWIAWMYPTTFTSGRRLASKSANKTWQLNGTGGAFQIQVGRATTATNYITNTNPLVLNTWNLVAIVFNSAAAAGEVVNLYRGALSAAPTECGYGTATDGSGAVTTDATGDFLLGNHSTVNVAWQGRIAIAGVFGAALASADITSWWRRSRKTIGSNVAAMFTRLGKNGADAIEYTGLTGTVTGATQGDGVPLDQGELMWEQDEHSGLFLMSA